ncbi:hypothetical protein TorRG33x02_049950 [Trema orientale]|uniref:Uncharacterized protein n=1 Tax=Trema orientale TaxID=63057 RepID=A0A2P5FMW4_TREOI|nr:hypothetical protein TorRG33x02_049950 [Trema orientale]
MRIGPIPCHNDGLQVAREYMYLVTEESIAEMATGEIMAQAAAVENVTQAPTGESVT